ncbi:phosphohydrolase (MutT/nudix family protein) [Bacillus cereus BAG1X2-3]|uniref:NUDIX domain-containing protein n=1 Tax=Bacillus cereus TaxID=1396 RepID=A0A9X7E4M5_BACCE|nr:MULTISPECIES: NUDIX domain-containing protein [Bacillus cereus group]EOO26990.1 phosphohydrolase (MutT/nudix family protein) [Bacillus cereus BAG1X1-1]EOO50225.1 phosphohydrolase (MutT/nudix family protein) [Bacillus cereus BAG1X2-1]EOO51025.1 phosphohydrolase (MutT/nudix family protein) [Bacillus cereus BAG1X2-2]EOO60705.1 phosphohydrolase (MutT/nudix family protein) [Bacillus cereus BAG1X2-3]EOP06974.1 phosphohydrolase (MutT/nudix family protein) [Bacillus cereus BAG2O-1]
MTMLYMKKVYAYITREKEGVMQLLVFKHRDIHEAGIQVPGGTVDEGETLEAAILREVQEESGLRHLCIERFLADYIIHVKEKQEYEKRHFFHVTLLTDVKDTWEHIVSAGEKDQGLAFSYEWVNIAKCPELAGKQGEFLHLLDEIYVK